jgi:hypothetical protein
MWDSSTREATTWWATAVIFTFDHLPADQFTYGPSVKGRGSPEGPLVDEFLAAIGPWAANVAEWTEAFVDQETGRVPSDRSGFLRGHGLEIWAVEGRLTSTRQTQTVFQARALPQTLNRHTLFRIIHQTNRQRPLPEEHRLLIEARTAVRHGQYRRAVIDAGTASELAMTELFDRGLARIGEPLRTSLKKENRTLGRLAELLAPLPAAARSDITEDLVRVRNNAVHANVTPTQDQAMKAVAIAEGLTNLVRPLSYYK